VLGAGQAGEIDLDIMFEILLFPNLLFDVRYCIRGCNGDRLVDLAGTYGYFLSVVAKTSTPLTIDAFL
jgi:hypothetical protein